jgi:hypothetical protein
MTQAKSFDSEGAMNLWLRQQGDRIRVINTATARKKWSPWIGFLTNAMTFTVTYEETGKRG